MATNADKTAAKKYVEHLHNVSSIANIFLNP
jgi:hypothetical protein